MSRSYSERMSANNDGMDPDWKPDLQPVKSDPIEKLKNLINKCDRIYKASKTVPDESKPVNGITTIHGYQVTCASTVWVEFCKAYEEVMFK